MADRLFFRSSRPPLREKPATGARPLRAVVAFSAVAGALYFLLGPANPSDQRIKQHFQTHRADFVRLQGMISTEPTLTSVGVDNVGDYWLYDGQWTASHRKFVTYSRNEMLESVNLPPERYEDYLDRLGRVGAYRVARQRVSPHGSRGTIFLLPQNGHRTLKTNIVFSSTPPEPLLPWAAARDSARPSFAELEPGWYVEFQNH